jgi:hypothetical protein
MKFLHGSLLIVEDEESGESIEISPYGVSIAGSELEVRWADVVEWLREEWEIEGESKKAMMLDGVTPIPSVDTLRN